MKRIVIVDYGMGNLGSVLNMFKHIGVEAEISSDLNRINDAEKLLLPGVGSFDQAMKRILATGLKKVLDKKALIDKVPILGICLGMQLLTRGSEEGEIPGFGWIEADTVKFQLTSNLKIPHMGWNTVRPIIDSKLIDKSVQDSRFYFVHSYYVRVDMVENSILKTTHGIEFDSGIQQNNIYGTQFHPEKSHRFGMNLLTNFSKI